MCSSILKQILVELNIFTSKLIILLCKIRDLRGLKIAYLKAFYSLFKHICSHCQIQEGLSVEGQPPAFQ